MNSSEFWGKLVVHKLGAKRLHHDTTADPCYVGPRRSSIHESGLITQTLIILFSHTPAAHLMESK
jgi:hypothetical protein